MLLYKVQLARPRPTVQSQSCMGIMYTINNLYGSQTFYGMKALYLLKLKRGILLCAPNIHIKLVFNICQLLVVLA